MSMFKTYGVIINNESSLEVLAGEDNQPVDAEKELFFSDGSYGAVRLDGATSYKLHEMEYTDAEFLAIVEAFKNGVFTGMDMIIAVENPDKTIGYIGCVDINNGTGATYFKSEITPGVAIAEAFFNSDAEDDERWEEYLAYTDAGRVI